MNVSAMLGEIRSRTQLSQERLAQLLGVSFISLNRWERGASKPSPAQVAKIQELYRVSDDPWAMARLTVLPSGIFSSRGLRRRPIGPTLFDEETAPESDVHLTLTAMPPIFRRLADGKYIGSSKGELEQMLANHHHGAFSAQTPPEGGMSAGKNTYTYDAHTYHTKVPPQGIAELLKHYLPMGGLVLDPFAGSGMTGVACRATGHDVVLNELSPAACFIANRFVSSVDPARYEGAVNAVLDSLQSLRARLYTTTCRECGKPTEILYTVWSYRVICNLCGHEFLLWNHARKYGKRVRDHKILMEFPCPNCHTVIKKSRLTRTIAEPVQIGYMCCGSRQQEVTHSPNEQDRELVRSLQRDTPTMEGFYPRTELPHGVNLQQPRHHGITRVDQFYSPRNLAAMSHLWGAIHHIEDSSLAAQLAFTFTSLYQRVTRLSEFRFWGGSGNTARFNVPYIFNEANVFVTFARKARSIQDHLETTASHYRGQAIVVQNSATHLHYLPDSCIDLIFTDPPFGANINYSEMNILWESWLQSFTDNTDEAIVNRVQGKDVEDYQRLMTQSLRECYRVLRPGRWLLLVFMNSSSKVWDALHSAIEDAGFELRQADIFDKQHGTFKQFVSENTAGCDLVLHCFKTGSEQPEQQTARDCAISVEPREYREATSEAVVRNSVYTFLSSVDIDKQRSVFLHVARKDEVDFRQLYSEWLATAILDKLRILDFADFRAIALQWIATHYQWGKSPS